MKQKGKSVGNALQIPTEEKRESVHTVSGGLGRLRNNRGRVTAKPARFDDFLGITDLKKSAAR